MTFEITGVDTVGKVLGLVTLAFSALAAGDGVRRYGPAGLLMRTGMVIYCTGHAVLKAQIEFLKEWRSEWALAETVLPRPAVNTTRPRQQLQT